LQTDSRQYDDAHEARPNGRAARTEEQTVVVNPKLVNTVIESGRLGGVGGRTSDRGRQAAERLEYVPNIGGEWYPEAPTSIQALKAIPGWKGGTPWSEKHQLEIIANGGLYSRDRRRLQVAGNIFTATVNGDRNVEVTRDHRLEVEGNATFSVQGADALKVAGDADWHAHDRMTLGAGNLQRRWEGPILRMIGMEGIICGGAFLKTFTGVSTTMAPLASGDVYGGAVRAAGARARMHGTMGYRSSEMCMWNCGVFQRMCATLIEPIVNTPRQDPPRNMLLKAGRIGMGLCPLADILFGLLSAPVTMAMAARNFRKNRGKPPAPPAGPPRVHMRTVGLATQTRASDTIM